MTVVDWVSVGANLVMAGAAVITTVVAILALRAWKDQLRGQSNYELARRLLRAANNVEFQIGVITTTCLLVVGRKDDEGPQEGMEHFDRVVTKLLQDFQTARNELYDAKLDAEIVWGYEAVTAVKALLSKANAVYSDAEVYLLHFTSDKYHRINKELLERYEKDMEKYFEEDEKNVFMDMVERIRGDMKSHIKI